MSRRVTVNLGFQGGTRDVALVIPDDEPTPWAWGEKFSVVGKPTPRLDGPAKATGRAQYTYDISLPGMLYGAILRSPYPHARIRGVDISQARGLAGVRAAIALDVREVRFAGEEVAAVAARSPDIANDALARIKVDYEPLPFVVDMGEALKDSAPRVFHKASNADSPSINSRGDLEQGLKNAAITHDAVYTTPVQTHVSLETHGAVASWNGDELTVWCSTQGIFSVRDDLASYFNLPPEKVRVITGYLGGGFGSKFGAGVHTVIAARLAREAGAPVKLMLPRAAEHVATGNRPNSWQRIRIGADRQGKLTAIELIQHGSGGVGGGSGSAGPVRNIYECANVRTEERNVFINAGPAAPMRAPGWPQGSFALELAIDELARKLSLDRLEMRRCNNTDPVRALEYDIGAKSFDWADKSRAAKTGVIRRGIGVSSAAWHAVGASGPEAQVFAFRDGHFEARIGTQDIGTGTRTIVAMVAAEELGVPLDRVRAEIGDTRYLFSLPSGGSMTAPSATPAVRQAAALLKVKLFRIAAPLLGAQPRDLVARDGAISVHFDPARSVAMAEVCRRLPGDFISAQGERVMNYEGFRGGQGGCQFAEVEVDTETGVVRVVKVVAVHDAGVILDPLTARSQVNGGVLMGLSFALFEERHMDPQTGLMLNPTMDDYKLVGALDTPDITALFVEVANGINNTSVLGLGEAAHLASAAAVGCAVADALGAPVRSLPITPDKVLAAIGATGRIPA